MLNIKVIQKEGGVILIELKKCRIQAGLTQEQLAKESGISRITINKLENGFQTITKSSTIIKLADTLKINPQILLYCKN